MNKHIETSGRTWYGSYRGIRFEIREWQINISEIEGTGLESDPFYKTPNWNYYIMLEEDMFPDEIKGEYIFEDNDGYFERGIARLYWHGGITFYERKNEEVVKAGCDFSHLVDMRIRECSGYTFDMVFDECARTIDSIYERVPGLKIWCKGCGEFFPHEELSFVGKRSYYCKDCKVKYGGWASKKQD